MQILKMSAVSKLADEKRCPKENIVKKAILERVAFCMQKRYFISGF